MTQQESDHRFHPDGNGKSGQMRPIGELLPRFHQELSRSTEAALLEDPQSRDVIRRKHYLAELSIWGKLQRNTVDMPQEQVDAEIKRRTQDFKDLKPEEQAETHRSLAEANELEIWKLFKKKADLSELLLRESGEDPDVLKKAKEITYKMFKRMTKSERAGELEHMDASIRHLFVAGFPVYLAEYEKMLAATGIGEAAAREEAALVRMQFEASDGADKVDIARSLREKVKEEPLIRFSNLMERYSKFIALGIIGPQKRGFISEQEWIDKLNEAQDSTKKAELLRVLEYVISKYEGVHPRGVVQGDKIETVFEGKPEKVQTDEEIFLEAIMLGVEDKDALESTITQHLDLAVKEYEKSLKSRGISSKQAKRLASERKESILSEIFARPDKAGFIAQDRKKDLAGALSFIFQFLPKQPLQEGSI